MNMQKMLKEMQKMQGKMARAQEELEGQTYEAEAGGGMVKVVMNGKGVVTELKLKEDVVDPDDVEALEDLLMAAFNAAVNKKDDATQQSMSSVTQGMNIPGLG
jgi:DNA-binding YbaB/EbfC family protein